MENQDSEQLSLNIFKCTQCSFQTPLRNRLKLHCIIHKKATEINYYNCQQCSEKFTCRPYLTRHIRNVHTPKNVQCPNCFFRTTNKTSFEEHFVGGKCFNKKMFKCRKCTFTADLRIKVIKHEKTHSVTKRKCPQCQKAVGSWGSLKMHQFKYHSNELQKQYLCEFCSFSGKSSSSLKMHKKSHSDLLNIALISCSHCDAQFFKVAELKHHIKTNHSDRMKNYECLHCGFKTNGNKSLINHIETHIRNGEIPRSEAENMRFSTNLQKIYSCSECAFITKYIKNLKKHSVIHTNEENTFKCLHCAFQSVERQSIAKHMMSHVRKGQMSKSEVRNMGLEVPSKNPNIFECLFCGLKSAYSKSIIRHIRIHIDKGEITKSEAHNLKCNMKVDPSNINNKYQCFNCDFVSTNRKSLENHMQIHMNKRERTNNEAKNIEVNSELSGLKIEQVKEGENISDVGIRDEKINNIFVENTISSIDKKMSIDKTSPDQTKAKKISGKPKRRTRQTAQFRCSECRFFSCNIEQFKKHVKIHQNPDFGTVAKIRLSSGKTFYKCQCCGIGLVNKRSLRSHANVHARANNDPTLTVSFDRYLNDKLLENITVEANEKVDGRPNRKFIRYVAPDANDVVYSCDECNFKTNTELWLQKHKNLHWTPDKQAAFVAKRWHTCDNCYFYTYDVDVFRKHAEFHKINGYCRKK